MTAAQLSEFCARNKSILSLVEFLLYREDADQREEFVVIDHRVRRKPRAGEVEVSSVALLKDTLQILFGLLSSRMLPADPNDAHKAIAQFVKQHPSAAIVTTNYDCCMDRALTADGLEFTYEIDFANSKHHESTVQLIKVHGSLNWFYCDTCQHVYLLNIEQTVADYLKDSALYPIIGVCKDCGGQRRGLLVPPLAMKFDMDPPLIPLRDRADDAFGGSELIVVVGFSFADADLYLTRMLTKAMQATNAQLVIIDPDFNVVSRVKRRFVTRIPNFREERISWCVGNCAELLPRFLSGAFLTGAAVPSSSNSLEAQSIEISDATTA